MTYPPSSPGSESGAAPWSEMIVCAPLLTAMRRELAKGSVARLIGANAASKLTFAGTFAWPICLVASSALSEALSR